MRSISRYLLRSHYIRLGVVTALCLMLAYGLPHFDPGHTPVRYLGLHTVLEFLAVFVGLSVGTLVWMVREGIEEYTENFLFVFGLAFFSVGIIDLTQVLSYVGMPPFFSVNSVQKALFLWLAGRFLAAAGFIAAVLLPMQGMAPAVSQRPKFLIAALAGLIAGVLLIATQFSGMLPELYNREQGLTQVKSELEIALIGLYAFCFMLLFVVKRRIRESIFNQLSYFLTFTILSESVLLFSAVSDLYLVLGHFYKVFASFCLFKAVYLAGIVNYFYTLSEMGKMSAELLKDQTSVEAVLQIQMPKLHKLIPHTEQSIVYFSCGPLCFQTAYSQGRFSELYPVGKEIPVNGVICDLGEEIKIINQPENLLRDGLENMDPTLSVILKACSQMMYIPLVVKGNIHGYIFLFTLNPSKYFSAEDVEKVRVFQQFSVLAVIQAKTQEMIAKLSFEDSLTGLPNRRYFFMELSKLRQQADAGGTPFTLVYVDMNNLKYLNDTVGHEAGDAALRLIGQKLRGVARKVDIPARLGGDEFGLLLRNVGIADATVRLAEVKDAFRQLTLEGCNCVFSAAVGGASYPEEAGDEENLIRLADDRMYEHKKIMKERPSE